MIKLLADLSEWDRRMRLREYFFKEKDDDESDDDRSKEEEKFTEKKKSSFTPRSGRDQWLDLYIELFRKAVGCTASYFVKII